MQSCSREIAHTRPYLRDPTPGATSTGAPGDNDRSTRSISGKLLAPLECARTRGTLLWGAKHGTKSTKVSSHMRNITTWRKRSQLHAPDKVSTIPPYCRSKADSASAIRRKRQSAACPTGRDVNADTGNLQTSMYHDTGVLSHVVELADKPLRQSGGGIDATESVTQARPTSRVESPPAHFAHSYLWVQR